MSARTSRYTVPPEVERSSEAHRCDRRIALEVSHAEKAQDAGQDEHGADEDRRRHGAAQQLERELADLLATRHQEPVRHGRTVA